MRRCGPWQQQERELLPPILTERPRHTLGVSSHPQDLRTPAESASRSLPLPGRAARPRAAAEAVAAAGAGPAAADSHRATTAQTGREQSPTGPTYAGGVCQPVSASAGQGGPAPCGGAGRGSSRSGSCCRRFPPSDHGSHWAWAVTHRTCVDRRSLPAGLCLCRAGRPGHVPRRRPWQQQERDLLPPIPTERPRLRLGVSSHPQDLRTPAESASRCLPLPGRAARPRAAVRAVAAAGAGAAAADSHRATTAHTGRGQSPTGPAWTGGVCQPVSASAGQGGPAPCRGAGCGSSRSGSCCCRFSPNDHGSHWA